MAQRRGGEGEGGMICSLYRCRDTWDGMWVSLLAPDVRVLAAALWPARLGCLPNATKSFGGLCGDLRVAYAQKAAPGSSGSSTRQGEQQHKSVGVGEAGAPERKVEQAKKKSNLTRQIIYNVCVYRRSECLAGREYSSMCVSVCASVCINECACVFVCVRNMPFHYQQTVVALEKGNGIFVASPLVAPSSVAPLPFPLFLPLSLLPLSLFLLLLLFMLLPLDSFA